MLPMGKFAGYGQFCLVWRICRLWRICREWRAGLREVSGDELSEVGGEGKAELDGADLGGSVEWEWDADLCGGTERGSREIGSHGAGEYIGPAEAGATGGISPKLSTGAGCSG